VASALRILIYCLTNLFFVKQIYKLLLREYNKISLAAFADSKYVNIGLRRWRGVFRFVSSFFDFLYHFLLNFRLGARSQTRGASWPREIFVLARVVGGDRDWLAGHFKRRLLDKSDVGPEKLAEFACVAATQKNAG